MGRIPIRVADLRGVQRLANDATVGITDLVEAMYDAAVASWRSTRDGFMLAGVSRLDRKKRRESGWPRAESNHRHKDFQSSALPTELLGRRREL